MRRHQWYSLACLAAVPILLGLTLSPLLAAGQSGTQPAPADDVAQSPPPAVLQRPPAPPEEKEPKLFKDVKEVTKDMGSMEGLFTIYRFDPADRKRDAEKLLAEIPASLLGEDLLFATSLSRGPMSGWMWRDALVRFEVAGKQLKLITPDVRYVRQKGVPITEAVERTYNDGFLAAVPIEAMSGKGDVVIDLEKLLKSDLAGVSFLGGRVRPELSTWTKVKVFPDNVLIDVDLALGEQQGGRKVGVSYAIRRLPKLGSYQPRLADPRVGYFLTAKIDWSKKYHERETFDRYIHRWKLEKQDPSLTLSPPKEPIMFIIEKTVPIQWRRWVREGIEDWNRAFEKIGFVGAIVVQQQTETNEYANYDPEDARYNFIRWGVSGSAFAMGPSRVDPRTGQILDADIIFDDAFVRAWMYQFDLFGPAAMAQFKGPGFRQWVQEQPEIVPAWLQVELAREADDPEHELWATIEEKLHEHGHCTCTYAWGMQQQLALAHCAMIATGSGPKELPERFIGEAIRQIVTHEVGHTLGLRHNFKASSWLPLDEIIRRRNQTDEPTSASIMDYNPLLFFAGDQIETVRHFITPTIGPYDEWAIEYGYAVAKGKSEEEMLKEITRRSAEPALQYATDEDTSWVYSPDPLVNRYDLSSNPMDFARSRAELVDKLMDDITDWAVQEGEPLHFLTRAFNVLWFERARNMEYVARTIGGQYFHRHHKGDPDAQPPFVLVEPARQREALEFLGQTIFNEEFFQPEPGLLNMLAPSRWSHWGISTPRRLDYPIHDRIRAVQVSTLLTVLAPPVLDRLYDAELKTDANEKFTVAELLTTLHAQIWRQLDAKGGPYSDAQPMISSIARNLQREHLGMLLNMAQARPGTMMSADVQAMVRLALQELSAKIGQTLDKAKPDFASRAHLVECQSRIDRALNAQFQAN